MLAAAIERWAGRKPEGFQRFAEAFHADERRDRGLLFAQLECPRAAAEDFLAYLSMHPAPPDARRIRERLDQMQRAARRLN
jgi:regulator of sirC expression with transglutaminase-like and TPR domain